MQQHRTGRWRRRLYRAACRGYGALAHAVYPRLNLPPLHIDIRNTSRCNLQCPYCSSRGELNQAETDRLGLDEWERIIGSIPRWTTISIEGGETFLAPDIMEVLDLLLARKLRASTITNGMPLDEDRIHFLVDRGLTYFICSIDGMAAYHNETRGHPEAFQILTRNVKYLRDYKRQQAATRPVVCIKTNLTGANSRDIPELLEFVEYQLGADEMFFNLLFDNPTQHGLRVVDGPEDPRLHRGNTFRYSAADHDAIRQALSDIERYRQTSRMAIGFSQGMDAADTMGYVANPASYSVRKCHEPWVSFLLHYDGRLTPCQTLFVDNIRHLDYNVRRVIAHPRYRAFLAAFETQMPYAPGCSGCCRKHDRRPLLTPEA